MNPRVYWMAGKRYEGCGHRHRSYATARACLARLERRGYRGGHVHRVTVPGRRPTTESEEEC